MFFDYFPTMYFKIDDTTNVAVTDFLRVIKIDPVIKENAVFFDVYQAQDGETPEIISHKMYKSTQYHWVIMLLNEKFDAYNDFPKTEARIVAMASVKYANVDAIHHYQDSNGNIVDQFYVGRIPITNIEYERAENEKKRSVKVLKPEVLSEFVQQYKKLIAV